MARKALQKRPGVVRGKRRSVQVRDTLLMFAQTRERFARLTDDLRIALALVVVDGLSYEEAARQLDIPVTSLLARLSMARSALGSMAAEDGRMMAAE